MRWIQAVTVLIATCFQSHSVFAQPSAAPNINDVEMGIVKVAAVQVLGYDKTDVPREGYDPTDKMLPYIDRAGDDNAQLVVFPEYVLGRISVPGAETEKISRAAAANKIYVIVGCWEVFQDGTYANTALIQS